MFDAHKNLAVGYIAVAPTSYSITNTFTLNAGEGALFAANMPVTLCPAGEQPTQDNAEIGYVTSVSGDTLSILRNQEGTTAKTPVAGWTITGPVTAKTLTDIETAVNTKASDAAVLHTTGVEVADGLKTFNDGVAVGPNSVLPAGAMGVDAPSDIEVTRVVNRAGGKVQLVSEDAAVESWAGGNNVTTVQSDHLDLHSYPIENVQDPTNAQDASTKNYTDTQVATRVPTTRTVNGHALSSNVTVAANDVLPTQTSNSGKFLTTNGTNSSWGTVSGGSGISRSVASITTTTSAGSSSSTDYVYLCSGTFTLTLPTAVSNTNRYTIKNTSTGIITLATTSSQTIDGKSTTTISTENDSIDLVSDNSNWRII